jgi:hypothetical protein
MAVLDFKDLALAFWGHKWYTAVGVLLANVKMTACSNHVLSVSVYHNITAELDLGKSVQLHFQLIKLLILANNSMN